MKEIIIQVKSSQERSQVFFFLIFKLGITIAIGKIPPEILKLIEKILAKKEMTFKVRSLHCTWELYNASSAEPQDLNEG